MILRRLILATLAAFGAIIIVVLVVTVADLYLVGHGYPSINREMISLPGVGVSMSPADIALLVVGLSTWCVTWLLLRRNARSP